MVITVEPGEKDCLMANIKTEHSIRMSESLHI